MNLFYANGTPVINSLKIQSEVPLDPRLNPETIEERNSLVTKHIAYDRMKVYVKETDSEYVYHKDKNEWVILSKFEKEEKDKLENIKNYLVDTEIIYDKDNNLLYREHSYDPNTNITSLRDYSIPEATVLGDGTLYNGLLSKFYVNRLNNVTGYQTDAKITSDTETESLFLTVTKYNPDTDESVTTNLNIPLVTDDNNGLVSPEKKHWMDNADGLSNTGTTSQTWQLQKSDIDTRLDPNGGVIIKNSGGKLEVRNNQDNSYAPVTLGDIIIEGNVTQKGESFITQAETVEVRDNTILLNRGETAAGVSKGFAGIEIDRGTLPKFQILFDESDRRFKAGEEGDLWCLALRDDDADMLNGMFTSWDSSTKRLKTTNIIPSDRKLAFTDNNSYLQLISHSFSGDALSQTLRYSNSLGGIFISAGNSSLNLDTDKTVFYFHKNITLPSTISSVSDFLFKRSNVIKLSLKDTVAQFTVPVTAITFNRASDGSEVLYHADLENTEFKNYITIAGPNDIKLYLKSTDEDNYNLISSVDQDGNKLSNMGYYGSYWAIENNRIAVYKYDANGYPEIINQDGTSPGYLRACTSGFLPNVSGNLASGGSGYLGTSSWAFANAYIANNHSNKYYFGTNDVFLDASTTRISARTTGAAIGMNVGSLLVSNDYSDETKVPDNGTYSKGAIKSYTGFTSDFRISNLTITKTGSDVLHISSFASDPENIPGTDPISSQVINDGVALTYFWQGDYAFQLVGDIDGTGMAYRMYHPSTGTSTSWKFLADTNWVSNKITSVAGNYLPLAGGTMTGSIIMSNNITIQSKDSGGNSKRLIGKGSDNVTYIGDSDGHTFLYSDAADIIHVRNGTSYRIWDASNLDKPVRWGNDGDNPHTIYRRNLGINGTTYGFLSENNSNSTSIYAPTVAGTSGQVLTSTGGVPTWSNISSVGDSRYVLKSGDTMTGDLAFTSSGVVKKTGNYARVIDNVLTSYVSQNSDVTGTLKITMPFGWNSTMMTVEVSIFSYNSYSNSKYIISGYNYNSTSSGWYNEGVSVFGTYKGATRLAYDGSKCCILIGTTTSIWHYPRVTIDKVTIHYSGYTATWEKGWEVNFITDESSITSIKTPTTNGGGLYSQGYLVANQNWVNSSFLPLTGGTLTGQTTISTTTQTPLILNYAASGGTECYIRFNLNGTASGAVGTLSSKGTYLYNYSGGKYLFLKSDGVYFGTDSSDVRLATLTDLSGYLPLSGGTMSGNIALPDADTTLNKGHIGTTKGESLLSWNGSNVWISSMNYTTYIRSSTTDLIHKRGDTSSNYKIWDAYNLDKPLKYNSGTAGSVTTAYLRSLGVNGTSWDFLSDKSTATTSIYAPTTVGTSGQILQSSGSGAPTWVSGYATQSWVTGQGYYKAYSTDPKFRGTLYIDAESTTGGWARAIWIGQSASDTDTGVSFGGFGSAATPTYAYIGVGANRGYSAVNNLKVYTDKVTFSNKTLATVDQIPTIPSISITTSGSGNVVTGISASGHTLTVTKGSASVSVSWNDITGKPSTYTPSAHSHDRLQIEDNRDVTMLPNNMGPTTLRTFFNANNMPTSDWYSGIHISGWITNYVAWQLCGPSSNNTTTASSLYFRSGKDSTWNSWKKIAFTSDIPNISISNSGSGNAVTAITANGHTLTVTKGATYLTSSSLSGYATQSWVTSQGYLTSSSLSGYATQTWVNNKNYAVQASGNNLIVNSNEFNFANTNTTSVYINYRSGVSGNTTNPITEYRFCNGQASNAGVKITAETFVGALSGNATTATTATKLGSSTVGGTAKPIYLSSGTATACSATVGSSTVPVYMNAGTITQCSTTLGVSITGNAATATTSTKWNGYDIWVGTESQLPSSRSSTTIYIVTDA